MIFNVYTLTPFRHVLIIFINDLFFVIIDEPGEFVN
eukprot:CCRYP_004373-RB/>CCRYP_004373-RB protein AED:0.48 eAED:0.48 QI:108/1/1/1/0/0/2/0/35